MRIQKLISAGFAATALASASVPALAWTVWPDVDFEWYAQVGKAAPGTTTVEVMPAPREGYIYSPGRWQTRGTRQEWVAGTWIKDDYQQQVAVYNNLNGTTTFATGPLTVYDSQGNPIPTQAGAYNIDSARK